MMMKSKGWKGKKKRRKGVICKTFDKRAENEPQQSSIETNETFFVDEIDQNDAIGHID